MKAFAICLHCKSEITSDQDGTDNGRLLADIEFEQAGWEYIADGDWCCPNCQEQIDNHVGLWLSVPLKPIIDF